MKLLIVAATGLVFASSAHAEAVDEFVVKISSQSEKECRADEASYRSAYNGDDAKVIKTISYVAEGTRLLCEAIRNENEQTRLVGEQQRLRKIANGLEADWQLAHSLNPEEFPDYVGRDASQKQHYKDIGEIAKTLNVLRNVHDNLTTEARRVLLLAPANYAQLKKSQTNVVVASLDDGDAYDIIVRMMKKVKA
jgi:hypothetical protein